MIHKCDSSQIKRGIEYTSLIKINGIPILPPLVTLEKVKELQHYKKEAVEIEKKLNCKKKLGNPINEDYSGNSPTKNLVLNNIPCKDSIFFGNDQNNVNLQTNFDDLSNLELSPKNNLRKYSLETLVYNNSDIDIQLENLNSKPHLIRSNSYTLESPSPVLLECLQRKGELMSTFNIKHKHEKTTRNEISKPASPHKETQLSYEDTTSNCFHSLPEKDNFGTEINKSLDLYANIENNDKILQPSSDNVEQSSGNNFDQYENKIVELLDTYKKQQQQRLESYAKLKGSLLGEISNIFSSKIEDDFVPKISSEDNLIKYKNDGNSLPEKKLLDTSRSNDNSISSQTIFFSNSCSVDTSDLEPKTDFLIDLGELNQNIVPSDCTMPAVNYTKSKKEDILDTINVSSALLDNNYSFSKRQFLLQNKLVNFNQEFSQINKQQKQIIQERAAEIICAAAKGFLVRRLMKTERVQILIQTIKDALLCAMQLHTELLERIQPADIELHSRLIQQVTAACYDFYDVFFTLSKKEQMSIIAVDRHKKRIKKPLLTPNSRKTAKIKNQVITSKYRKNIR